MDVAGWWGWTTIVYNNASPGTRLFSLSKTAPENDIQSKNRRKCTIKTGADKYAGNMLSYEQKTLTPPIKSVQPAGKIPRLFQAVSDNIELRRMGFHVIAS